MNWISVILMLIISCLIGLNRKCHHNNLNHVWLVGLGLRTFDQKARKLVRQREYHEKYLEGLRRQSMRRSIYRELHDKPRKQIKTDLFGIPIRRQ